MQYHPHTRDSFLRQVPNRGWCLIKECVSSWVVLSDGPVLEEANLYHGRDSGGGIHRRYPLRK